MDVTNSHQPEVMEFFVLFYSPVSLSLFFFSLCRFISHCDILFIKGRKIVQFEANLYRSMEGGGGEGINTPNWYVSSFSTPHCSFLILYVRARKTYIVVTSMLNALRLQCPEESGFARRLHGNDTDATRAYSP